MVDSMDKIVNLCKIEDTYFQDQKYMVDYQIHGIMDL